MDASLDLSRRYVEDNIYQIWSELKDLYQVLSYGPLSHSVKQGTATLGVGTIIEICSELL